MYKVRHWIEFILYKSITLPFILLPRSLRMNLGSMLGYVFYYIDYRHRKVTFRNLEIAFPDKDDSWKKRTAKSSFKFFGRIIGDIITFHKISRLNFHKYFEKSINEGHLKNAYKKGKGVLCLAFHFGNWEFLQICANILGYRLASITRRLDNPLLEREILKIREVTNGAVIYKKNAIRNIRKYLKNGYLIGILADQNQIVSEGMFVEFFNNKACTTPSIALLSLKYDIPIVPVYSLLSENNKYIFYVDKPISIQRTGNKNKDIRLLTQKYTTYIENLIRKHPDKWLWMHKRWNTRPEGEPSLYD